MTESAPTDHAAANAEERERLRGFLDGLSDEQLAQPIGGGWTPAVALGYLAFWDRRHAFMLDRWAEGTPPPVDEPEWLDDRLNRILVDEWAALPPSEAARLALEAAESLDERIADLEPEKVESVLAMGELSLIARSGHRREHREQIEEALGLTGRSD